MARGVRNESGHVTSPIYYDDGLQVLSPQTPRMNKPSEFDGLQAVPNETDPGQKPYPEVAVGHEGKETTNDPFQPGLEPYVRSTAPPVAPKRSRRRLWYGLIAGLVILVLIIVVAVVVAVVVTRKKDGSAQTPAPSSSPSPVNANGTNTGSGSTTGVWNGTGMAAMTPFINNDPVWLVSQRYTGEVQLSRLNSSGTWHDPQVLQLPNVMNGTFLEAISYIASNETFVSSSYWDALCATSSLIPLP